MLKKLILSICSIDCTRQFALSIMLICKWRTALSFKLNHYIISYYNLQLEYTNERSYSNNSPVLFAAVFISCHFCSARNYMADHRHIIKTNWTFMILILTATIKAAWTGGIAFLVNAVQNSIWHGVCFDSNLGNNQHQPLNIYKILNIYKCMQPPFL